MVFFYCMKRRNTSISFNGIVGGRRKTFSCRNNQAMRLDISVIGDERLFFYVNG